MDNELKTRNIVGPYRDNTDNPSKFRVIASVYRDKILSGAKGYTTGCTLPTSRAMASMHHTTRPTVEKAMQLLVAEGLLIANGNQPPFIAERLSTVPTLDDRMATLRATGKILTEDESCEILEARTVTCPDSIAKHLGVTHEDQVLLRSRVTRRNGRPIAYSESYYPEFAYQAAPELGDLENVEGGAREAAVYALERTQEGKLEAHTARIASDREKQLLELTGKYSVVIQTLRVVYLNDGRPVEAAVKVSSGSHPVVHRRNLGS